MATLIQQTIGRRTRPTLLHLRADDDVAIATGPFPAGTSVALSDGGQIDLVTDIPSGHKVAVRDLAAGTLVHKYGHVIGATTAPVRTGEHVHTHNLGMPPDPTALATVGGAPLPRQSRPTCGAPSRGTCAATGGSAPATTSSC